MCNYIKALCACFFITIVSINCSVAQVGDAGETRVPLENALKALRSLSPYKVIQPAKSGMPAKESYRLSATDVAKTLPGAVKSGSEQVPGGKNAFTTRPIVAVDFDKLVPVLVGAILEQQAEIERLRKEVSALRK